jgi:2-dehydro-3-deoxyphosphogluconate aldolase/(4S)-4-hydroxy-2-oxoglutarate aldolase|tara:strand:- start:228 stop:875 length:648 start_codon:yes stop_codon:yes gene_type:complete
VLVLSVKKILELGPVIPVVVIDEVTNALALVDALLEGGIKVIEVTLRTEAALLVMEKISRFRPEIILGAGTILNSEQGRQAKEVGAKFGVSPGTSADIILGCKKVNLPLLPGAATVSEMISLSEKGFSEVKFFPAAAAGGIEFVKSLISPMPFLQVCPTGGITVATAHNWLSLSNVPSVGGSWIASKDDISRKDFSGILARAREATALSLDDNYL